MERNRGQAEAFLEHGRQQMLAGMLLHVVEAPRPVDATVHFRICWTVIDDMNDFVAFIANVEDVGVADLSQIVWLASGRGVERRAVKNQFPDASRDSRVHVRREAFYIQDSPRIFLFNPHTIITSP